MKKAFVTFTIATLCNLPLAQSNENNSQIISVTPDFIKMRHAATIQVQVSAQSDSQELSIIPGGIFLESIQELAPGKKTILLQENILEIIDKHSFNRDFDIIKKSLDHTLVVEGKSAEIRDNNKKIKQFNFNSKIIDATLSNRTVCLQLKNNDLIHINIDNDTVNSTRINSEITALAQYNDFCITSDKTNKITLWKTVEDKLEVAGSFTLNNLAHKIILQDNLLLIANDRSGLTVLEIDENNNILWTSSYNKLGNTINLANFENEVLVADDEGILTLIDISGPNRPLLISDFFLNRQPSTLLFGNGKAYALEDNTLLTINFESQSPPMISTLGVNQGGSRRSFIDKNILYVADWFSGLHLYDISQPHLPKHISSFHTPGSPKGVLVRNDIAYVADDDHGLQILNVKNPRLPVLISNLPLEGLAYTMKLRGNTLFLASHYGGFHLIDVSIANQPKLIGTVNTPGKSWALDLKGNELYVADDTTGLLVFNIDNPATPTLISQFNPDGFVEDIVIIGNRAYLAFFDLGLFILDISDAKNIRVISSFKTPGSARGIEIHDKTLYLASWEAGVTLIDISNENIPVLISQYDTDGATWGLSVKDKIVYAMDWWGGVKVIDANQPHNLRQIAKYQTEGKINDLKLQANFLYTAHGARGLQIYEASNVLNPVWSSGVDIDGNANAIAVDGNIAIIASEDAGVNVIDISNSFEPKWLSKIQFREKIIDVALEKHRAVALADNGNIFIIDLHRPANPAFETYLPLNVTDMQIVNSQLWCLNNGNELLQLDISDIEHVKKVRSFSLNKSSKLVRLFKDYIYLVTIDNEISKSQIKNDRLEKLTGLSLKSKILDVLIQPGKLFVTTDDRVLNLLNDEDKLALSQQYSSTHRILNIAASNNGVYFSGESLIASGQLLPAIDIKKSNIGFDVNLPNDMPLGTYHMALSDKQGNQNVRLNAFEIGFPKFKPKFTMEDLKKKLQDKNLPGKASVDK